MTRSSTTREKLTNSVIKDLKPEIRRVNDTEIAGFHILVSDKGRITYYLYYRINGKQVNFKLGVHPDITPAQARDLAKRKAGDVANGVDVQEERKEAKRKTERDRLTKLSIFLEQKYLPYQQTRNPKTAEKIIREIHTGFPHLLDKQLAHITPHGIERWRNEKRKAGLTASTINGYVATLKAALNRAVDWGLLDGHDLNKIKALKSDNKIVRYLDDNEEQQLRETMKQRDAQLKEERDNGNKFRQMRGYDLLPELKNAMFADHLEPIVLLAMNTGLRKGEILNLKWEHVNIDKEFLTIISDNAKSGKTRHVPLNGEAKRTLKGWLKANGETLFVFESSIDTPYKDIKKSWGKLLVDASIENFRFHDLRHHFASKLVMAGVDLNTVRELLGHGNLEMTLRYAHLAPEHKAAAVNLIG